MTKKDFIKLLAEKQDISQVASLKQLDDFKATIKNGLISGEEVNLGSDFGTFKRDLN